MPVYAKGACFGLTNILDTYVQRLASKGGETLLTKMHLNIKILLPLFIPNVNPFSNSLD